MSSGTVSALNFSTVEEPHVAGWRNRAFFELGVGYGLILMVIWSPEPVRIVLYFVTLGWIGYTTWRSFSGWDVMGVNIGGLANSLWVVGTAVCLAGSAIFVARQEQTLHSPRSLMRFTQNFWGYVLWSFFQQFLLQDFVLRRLLKLTNDRRVAVIGAAGLFALAHLPNSMLTAMTLVWGVVACLIFLRYRNLITLGVMHAILGISVAITVPAAVQHDMRVGLGYLKYRPRLQHRHNPMDRKLLATVSVKVPLEREFGYIRSCKASFWFHFASKIREGLRMLRPYWSGQIQISLVSFGVKLFSATEAKSEIRFHQLSRKTGERIKHQKVSGDDGPVETSDVVKGYEYRKGEYVTVEPEEIEHLRIPSRHTLEVTQFVDEEELDPEFFEKPYFVVPENDVQAEAFAVVRQALQVTKKIALGKIAFGGREHLVAVSAPADDKLAGMMAYTMRYAEELRDPAEYFEEIKKVPVDADQLSLAKELIKRKAAKFVPEKFKDEYEAALREMVEAKVKHAPIPQDEPAPKSGKVINLMDALRKSVRSDEPPAAKKKVSAKSAVAARKGITLVKPETKTLRSRKSA